MALGWGIFGRNFEEFSTGVDRLLGGKIPMGCESSFPACAEAQAKDENGPDGVGRPKSVGNGVKQYVGQHGGLRDRGGGLGGHLKSGHRRSPPKLANGESSQDTLFDNLFRPNGASDFVHQCARRAQRLRQAESSALWECGNRGVGDFQARWESRGNRRSVFLVSHGASFPQGYSVVAAVFVRQLLGPHFSTCP